MTRGPGAFTDAARAAILASHPGCVCCGQPATELHHRAPRRAGGTRRPDVGAAHNGLPMCQRAHAWTESHRAHATRLGWLLHDPDPAVPFWTVRLGWCRWVLLDDGPPCWCIQPFQPSPGPDADQAVGAFTRQEAT